MEAPPPVGALPTRAQPVGHYGHQVAATQRQTGVPQEFAPEQGLAYEPFDPEAHFRAAMKVERI